MLDSVLRVFATDFDVDDFLGDYPIQAHTEPFRKGEADLLGNPNDESGFDSLLLENDDPVEILRAIHAFITTHEDALSRLMELEVNCVVDIGFTVGTTNQFTQSICVPPQLLGILQQFNISLEVSSYPGEVEEAPPQTH